MGAVQGNETVDSTLGSVEPAASAIGADPASCFTYASYQNAVPIPRSIEIRNAGYLAGLNEAGRGKITFRSFSGGDLLDMPDPPRDMARLLGLERLAETSCARLDEAIARARLRMSARHDRDGAE